jgi:hypothetical protein
MYASSEKKIDILNDHYKDTFSHLVSYRKLQWVHFKVSSIRKGNIMSQIIYPQDREAVAVDFPKEQRLKRKMKPSPKAECINMIPPKGINSRGK